MISLALFPGLNYDGISIKTETPFISLSDCFVVVSESILGIGELFCRTHVVGALPLYDF